MRLDIPIYREPIGFESSPVDPMGQLALALEEPGWPQVFGISALLEGHCEVDLFSECISEVSTRQGGQVASLVGLRRGGRERLAWRRLDGRYEPEIVDRRNEPTPTGNYQEWLPSIDLEVDAFEPDITTELPARTRITSLADDLHVVTTWSHHAAGDAGTFLSSALATMSLYHERVAGEVPPWASRATMHSDAATPAGVETAGMREFLKYVVSSERTYPRDETTLIAGTPGEPRPISVPRVIDDDDVIDQLRGRARALGGSMTDLVLAASKIAIAEWNETFGVATNQQSHAIVVNVRGRMVSADGSDLPNQLSMIPVNSKEGEWSDPEQLLRKAAETRRTAIDRGYDVLVAKMAMRSARLTSVLPIRGQLAFVNRTWAPRTLSVSNVGTVFPEFIDGRTVGGFALPKMGDLQPAGNVMRSNTMPTMPNVLTMARNDLGLVVVLSGNEATTTSAELAALHEQIIAKMLAYLD